MEAKILFGFILLFTWVISALLMVISITMIENRSLKLFLICMLALYMASHWLLENVLKGSET